MAKSGKKSGGTRKYGRNDDKCAVYRTEKAALLRKKGLIDQARKAMEGKRKHRKVTPIMRRLAEIKAGLYFTMPVKDERNKRIARAEIFPEKRVGKKVHGTRDLRAIEAAAFATEE